MFLLVIGVALTAAAVCGATAAPAEPEKPTAMAIAIAPKTPLMMFSRG